MAQPTNREEFSKWCLRKLGAPVIEINVSEEQVDDRIDEALKYWKDYHYDGSNKVFLKYQLTQVDIDNGYIPIDESIIGITKVFPMSTMMSVGMFSASYQMTLNAIGSLQGMDLSGYYQTRTQMALMEEILVGKTHMRFNRHVNKLYIDTNWEKQTVGDWVLAEAYAYTDPDVYSDVWKDKWLQKYASELIKEQWGRNLTKFSGLQLPGGVQFNGESILQEARENIAKMEEEMISSYSLPVCDITG